MYERNIGHSSSSVCNTDWGRSWVGLVLGVNGDWGDSSLSFLIMMTFLRGAASPEIPEIFLPLRIASGLRAPLLFNLEWDYLSVSFWLAKCLVETPWSSMKDELSFKLSGICLILAPLFLPGDLGYLYLEFTSSTPSPAARRRDLGDLSSGLRGLNSFRPWTEPGGIRSPETINPISEYPWLLASPTWIWRPSLYSAAYSISIASLEDSCCLLRFFLSFFINYRRTRDRLARASLSLVWSYWEKMWAFLSLRSFLMLSLSS